MKVLIIHQYFLGQNDPGGSRFNQFAKYWAARGHEVTVIAGTVHYATGQKDEQYRRKWVVEEEYAHNIRVMRCYVSEGYNKSFGGRVWGYLSFVLSALWAGLFRAGKHDLILATSPPLTVGIPGIWISRLKRIPFLFEVRDLWPESAIETGVLSNNTLIKIAYWLERRIYDKASRINVLTPAFRNALLGKSVPSEKIEFIPNGADLDIFKRGPRNNWVREKHGWGNKFVVLYMGAHGVANCLDQLLDVAEDFRDRQEFLFVFVGDGMEKPKLMTRANALGLENVQFIDSQSKAVIVDYTNAADVCTAVLKKVDTFKTVYPNKLFDYMACAKPIILAIDGVARELLESAEAGIFVPPEDSAAFGEAVLQLYKDPELAQGYGESGYQYVVEHFSRESLAVQYESILEKMMQSDEIR